MTSKTCSLCGGQLEPRQVEKVLRGGEHSTNLRVDAEVCLWCGESVYTTESVARFERIRRKLSRGDLAEFTRADDFAQAPAGLYAYAPEVPSSSPSELRHPADNGVSAWVVRGGRQGKWEDAFFEHGLASIDFGLRHSVSDFGSQAELRDYLIDVSYRSYSSVRQAAAAASQLWRFANVVRIGDVALMPRKKSAVVAAGRISGEYVFQPQLEESQFGLHTRDVEWLSNDIPRSSFDPDIINSMRNPKTLFQPTGEDASRRIVSTLKSHLAESRNGGQPVPARNSDGVPGELNRQTDRYKDAVARIRRLGAATVEVLVAEVLRASGYVVSSPQRYGEDGAIDFLAGKGDLGFDQPRLRVMVKARTRALEDGEYNKFRQDVESDRQGATHGLLVSLAGFVETVHKENARSFYRIRLWGPDELARRLLETYDALPPDIRAEIPLENRKVLVEG